MDNQEQAQLEEKMMEFMMAGGLPYEMYGITTEELEALYAKGYIEYSAQQFDKALTTFSYLAYLKTDEKKYLVAFAATLHAMKDYEKALQYYALAQNLDLRDPIITFHIIECLVALKKHQDALEALDILCKETIDQPQWAPLYAKALAYQDLLKQKRDTKK